MTILGLFINNEIRTGANRRYLELMEGLAERGNTVRVIMNSYLSYTPTHFERIDLPVKYQRGKFPPASILLKFQIWKNFSQLSPKLKELNWIHIHGDMHLTAALYLRKKTGARFFYAVRCDDISRSRIKIASGSLSRLEKIKEYLYIYLKKKPREKKIARYADMITFQNFNDRNIFLNRTKSNSKKTCIIPGNIGLPRFINEWKNTNYSKTVKKLVYVGALSASKGFLAIIELLDELKKRGHSQIILYALGRTKDKTDIFNEVEMRGLSNMIVFTGYVNPFKYFSESDLMVYPSLYDAWPDSVMEAIFTGCPAIASSVGGLPEMLKYSELLFQPGNVQQMADMVEHAITDPIFYATLRRLCAERVNELTFDWVEKFEEIMSSHTKVNG